MYMIRTFKKSRDTLVKKKKDGEKKKNTGDFKFRKNKSRGGKKEKIARKKIVKKPERESFRDFFMKGVKSVGESIESETKKGIATVAKELVEKII